MTTFSNSRFTISGDVDTGRGQLGIGWSGVATTSALWSLRPGANHYLISSAAPITITLPDVGTGSTQAQPGYWVTIANVNATDAITINNFAASTLATLTGGKGIMLVATTTVAANWVIQYDTTSYGGGTSLQQAYNSSGIANPQITLSSTNGALKVYDAATPIASLLNIANNAGTTNYLRVFNSVTGTQTPAVILFGGAITATGAANNLFIVGSGSISGVATSGSVVFGSGSTSASGTFLVGQQTVSGANTTALSDGSATFSGATYSGTNTFYQLYTGGSWAYSGATQEGTTKTSPNKRTLYFSANAVTTAGATTALFTSATSTTYRVTVTAYGRDPITSSAVSATHIIEALVTNLSGTATVVNQQLRTIETAGYITIPSNATLTAATNVVSVNLVAPDNVNGPGTTGMDYRIICEYCALTE